MILPLLLLLLLSLLLLLLSLLPYDFYVVRWNVLRSVWNWEKSNEALRCYDHTTISSIILHSPPLFCCFVIVCVPVAAPTAAQDDAVDDCASQSGRRYAGYCIVHSDALIVFVVVCLFVCSCCFSFPVLLLIVCVLSGFFLNQGGV